MNAYFKCARRPHIGRRSEEAFGGGDVDLGYDRGSILWWNHIIF